MINDSKKLQDAIDDLGALLMVGDKMKESFMKAYDTERLVPSFKPEDFADKWEKAIEDFVHNKVIAIVQVYLGKEHYYVFHMKNPTMNTILISGWHYKFNNVYNWLGSYMKALEDIIFRLEDQLALVVKREIAQKEDEKNVRYKITFSEHSRSVRLNGIELSKPSFNGLSHTLFSYVYNRPGQVVKIADLEEEEKIRFSEKRRPVQVLADLGFKGKLRAMFFPICTKTEIKFVNPITDKYAEEQDLPYLSDKDLSGRVRQSGR